MIRIFLDPGHGGTDSGAVGNNLIEKDLNLYVAKKVKYLLELENINVLMSREEDIYPSLEERVTAANNYGANYFISIHHNAGGGDGFEIIYSVAGGKSKEIAERIGKEFEAIGQNKRSIYYKTNSDGLDYFYVIRKTIMPAIITEFAFLDSQDSEIIDSNEELNLEAKAIANGILKQLGITPIDNNFVSSVNKLYKNNVVTSPAYWLNNEIYNPIYVKDLVNNFTGIDNFEESITILANKKIINSPSYWLDNTYYNTEYVRELIKKLAYSLEIDFINSVNELSKREIITSPDYWIDSEIYGTEYVKKLIIQFNDYITNMK